jgi:hypothetical protein
LIHRVEIAPVALEGPGQAIDNQHAAEVPAERKDVTLKMP